MQTQNTYIPPCGFVCLAIITHIYQSTLPYSNNLPNEYNMPLNVRDIYIDCDINKVNTRGDRRHDRSRRSKIIN